MATCPYCKKRPIKKKQTCGHYVCQYYYHKDYVKKQRKKRKLFYDRNKKDYMRNYMFEKRKNNKIIINIKEKLFADLLDTQGRKWIYHPMGFKLNDNRYAPDFYLPEEDLYIEIVGSKQAYYYNRKKLVEFKSIYSHLNFIVVDYLGNEYERFNKYYNNSISRK